MDSEEVQDLIIGLITYEFPTLRIETVCDIADIVGDGWDWREEYLPQMEKYVQNNIAIYSKEEFVELDEGLYDKALELHQDNQDMVMDSYCEILMDRHQCVVWADERFAPSDSSCNDEELVPIYVWCD